MSLHLVFITQQTSATVPPVDGQHVASTTGWGDFCDWVLARHTQFPECAYLTDDPVDEAVPGSLQRLHAELVRISTDAAPTAPDVAGVARSLAAALAAQPPGTVGVYVSDGEPADSPMGDEPPESNVYG